MRGTRLIILLALACGDSGRECHRALPESNLGEPWPTYTVASTEVSACTQPQGPDTRIGTCSDGKAFIDQGRGLSGEISYFRGEQLVGFRRWSDLVMGCTDNESLGDTDCAEVEAEELGCP